MQAPVSRVGRFAHPKRNTATIGVEPGQIIADFGAGSGHYTLHFADLLEGTGRVYAVDVQPDLLSRIKHEATRWGLNNVETVHGDIEREEGSMLADALVDLVVLSNTLFQLEDKAAALAEAWRVLKPTGVLALIEWSDSFAGMGPLKKHIVEKDAVLSLARDNHFGLVREFQAGAHHYGLLLKPVPKTRV